MNKTVKKKKSLFYQGFRVLFMGRENKQNPRNKQNYFIEMNKTHRRVKGRMEILRSKILSDLDTVKTRIMQAGQWHTCPLPLTTDTNIVNLTEKFERKEITENRRNKQNSPEKNFPLLEELNWK